MNLARLLFLVMTLALTLTACATPRTWYGVPTPIDAASIAPIRPWAGTPVTVDDGRPAPTPEPVTSWAEAGLTWETYSARLVQETRRAFLEALGPAQGGAPVELRVTILEHGVRFDAPNWVGASALEAEVMRAGQPTGQRWAARGQAIRWNWQGMGTAGLANQRAYEEAVQDLIRQIALSRPPQ